MQNHAPPKAEVTGSIPVGCAILDQRENCGAVFPRTPEAALASTAFEPVIRISLSLMLTSRIASRA